MENGVILKKNTKRSGGNRAGMAHVSTTKAVRTHHVKPRTARAVVVNRNDLLSVSVGF